MLTHVIILQNIKKQIYAKIDERKKVKDPNIQKMYLYLDKWRKNLEYTKATTCAYQFISKEEDNIEFIQYFLMRGLGACVRQGSHTSHLFYAGLFSHCTAVPLFVKDNKIFFHDNNETNIFAWGGG